MYCITDQQIEYILNDIRRNGVEMEDLQLNLLDHICCLVEQQLEDDGDFERFYKATIKQFYKHELREIEEETINLLTFKNFYKMKKIMMVSGAMSVAAFIAGSLFKIMYWPGASVLLLLGIGTFSLLFLPLVFLLKAKEANSQRDKLMLVFATISGILYCMSTLFAIMHWPGRTAMWLTAVGVSVFLFIPTYFFSGIRKPETKLNTITTTILLMGISGLLFTLIALRPPALPATAIYTYIKNEQLLKTMQHKQGETTSANADAQLITTINKDCEQIKSLILQQEIGLPYVPGDFEQKNIVFREQFLGKEFYSAGGLTLLADLRKAVAQYNTTQAEEHKLPVEHSVLDMPGDNNGQYVNVAVLTNLVQLQLYLVSFSYPEVATK